MMTAGMICIALCVTLLPLLVKKVGQELEIFLFLMGVIAVTVTSQWSVGLVLNALQDPIKITAAVLAAGLLFHFFTRQLEEGVRRLRTAIGAPALAAGVIVLVGLLSSFITAIIASLVLVEAVRCMKLDRREEVRLIVLACFSIGLGAALTPVGEPLSTVAISKLSGEPYHAGFWFLLGHLWPYVIPAIVVLGAAGAVVMAFPRGPEATIPREDREPLREVFIRTAKVYIFVVGLVFLGTGFTPIVDRLVGSITWQALYWANITSAVLDNATLTAAEIVPSMSIHQIVAALMGLLVAGGILVPGNIPNIVAAGRLKIDARSWARIGVPVGVTMMAAIFVVLLIVSR
jgi:predicted cation transporter